jgi:hypothetical protein
MLATAGYGWHYETSLHALRLILAGVCDQWPALKIILGHLGEGIPFHLGRIDDVLTPLAGHLAKPISAYFRENFWVTTSGYFFDGPFRLAREVFGDDRIMCALARCRPAPGRGGGHLRSGVSDLGGGEQPTAEASAASTSGSPSARTRNVVPWRLQ